MLQRRLYKNNWKAFDLFLGVQNDLMVIWCSNITGKGDTRFLAKEGTAAQVKFWLVNYLEQGVFEEMSSRKLRTGNRSAETLQEKLVWGMEAEIKWLKQVSPHGRSAY